MRNQKTKQGESVAAATAGSRTLRRQTRMMVVLAILLVILTVCAAVAYYYMNRDNTSFVHEGMRYTIEKRNGIYVLVDGNGKVCNKDTGYYATVDGKKLIDVNAETGEFSIYAALDNLEGNEQVGNVVTQRILIFPYTPRANMQAVSVYNYKGSYSFYLDDGGQFQIKGAESATVLYDEELFASLVVSSGYPLAMEKIENPIKDADGDYHEYGLKNSKNYWVLTALNEKQEEVVYKMVIGNKLPSGGGYYVQYVDCADVVLNEDGTVKSMTEKPRDAVYVLSTTIETTLLVKIEEMAKPILTSNKSLSTYAMVQNFFVMKGKEALIGLDFVDMDLRTFSELSAVPFKMLLKEHQGLTPSSTNVTHAMEGFYNPVFIGCEKLPIFSDTYTVEELKQDLLKYGIYSPYEPSFEEKDPDNEKETLLYSVKKNEDGIYALYTEDDTLCELDAEGCYLTKGGAKIRILEDGTAEHVSGEGSFVYTPTHTVMFDFNPSGASTAVEEIVYFSYITQDETYYAYSPNYNMIVEVGANEFDFLTWDTSDWCESSVYQGNIAYVDRITVESSLKDKITFLLNNTESSQGDFTKITKDSYTDSKGNLFLPKRVDGVYGLYKKAGTAHKPLRTAWFRLVKTTSSSGSPYETYKVRISYTGMPSGGSSEGWFRGSIYITGDNQFILCSEEEKLFGFFEFAAASSSISVVAKDANGKESELPDPDLMNANVSGISNFREFYTSILYTTIEGDPKLSKEEEAELLSDPSRFQLRVTIHTADRDMVFEFYYLTSRKSYLRISADGGETFSDGVYILTTRVNKIIADTERLLAGQIIDPAAKN